MDKQNHPTFPYRPPDLYFTKWAKKKYSLGFANLWLLLLVYEDTKISENFLPSFYSIDFAPAWLAQASKIPFKITGSWSKTRKKKTKDNNKKTHYIPVGVISYNIVLFFTFSDSISSAAVTSFPHLPSVVNSQPAMHPGLAAAFQYPATQAKPVLPETKTDWRIPPRKNEDR